MNAYAYLPKEDRRTLIRLLRYSWQWVRRGERPDAIWVNLKSWISRSLEWGQEQTKEEAIFMPSRVLDLGDSRFDLLEKRVSRVSPSLRAPVRLRSLTSGNRFPDTLTLDDCEGKRPRKVCHLYSGRTQDRHYTYATLSHRWGDNVKGLRTAQANLQNHYNEICFDDLPMTFQDAVIVTRLLGIRFLWIDALCIIQDNPNDWLAEAKMMARIFGNALVNISAHATTSDRDGFLSKEIPISLLHKKGLPPRERSRIDDFPSFVDRSSLSRRGWVFQERLLSPRILHFARNGSVFMEDINGCWAENGDYTDCLGIRAMWKQSRWDHDWYRMMETYMDCDLTYEKDRLSAIEGLAAEFVKRCNGQSEYWAGLWASSVCEGLLWHLSNGPCQSQLSDTFSVCDHHYKDDLHDTSISLPTWSWAFHGKSIRFHHHLYLEPHLEFCGFTKDKHHLRTPFCGARDNNSSILKMESPNGQLPCPRLLSVRGYIKPMHNSYAIRLPAGVGLHNPRFFNKETDCAIFVFAASSLAGRKFIGWASLDPVLPPVYPLATDLSQIYCLFVATRHPKYDAIAGCPDCRIDSEHFDSHTELAGYTYSYVLLLKRREAGSGIVDSDDEVVYERVGIAMIYPNRRFPGADAERVTVNIS